MSKADVAERLFREGYNCAQAVTAAFCEGTGLDEKLALRMSAAFGGGLGRMREVCGAVLGMNLVLSLVEGYDNLEDKTAKQKLYATVQKLTNEFKARNGSYICRELLGLSKDAPVSSKPEERTQSYYAHRTCVSSVRSACDVLEEYLREKRRE